MKEEGLHWLDNHSDEIINIGQTLFQHAELGFKEFETKSILEKYLKQHNIEIEKEYFETGFQVSFGQGKPHIGCLCELDGIPTPGHPFANPNDQNAAHSCGHSTQVAVMLAVMRAVKETNLIKYGGKITFFFTPAEEFTDLAYRKTLVEEKKIQYLAGKINMLTAGCFDDVDCCIHLHAMGEYRCHRFAVNSTLAGFTYKKFTFHGKASHAAVFPDQGVNALNAFALFQSAVGMLRETFKEEDINRVHGIVTHGGDTVNSIPDSVVYESYVRSFNTVKLKELSTQLTNTAQYCAKALNGWCEVEDIPGYLPFHQNRQLSEIIRKNMLDYTTSDQILDDEKSVAAGDIGDLGCFVPTIQFGYTGFVGVVHGKDLLVQDENQVYIEPAKIVFSSLVDCLIQPELVQEIKSEFKPSLSWDEYLQYLQGK